MVGTGYGGYPLCYSCMHVFLKSAFPVGKHGMSVAIDQFDGHNVPFGAGYFDLMPLVAMRMASSWLSVTVNKSMSDSLIMF